MANFGQRLRNLRNSQGISQSELSKHIGISKSSINMYERGEREPGFETLEAIADFFNVNMDYLLGRAPHISIPVPKIGPFTIRVDLDGAPFSDAAQAALAQMAAFVYEKDDGSDPSKRIDEICAATEKNFSSEDMAYLDQYAKVLTAALKLSSELRAKYDGVGSQPTQGIGVLPPQE